MFGFYDAPIESYPIEQQRRDAEIWRTNQSENLAPDQTENEAIVSQEETGAMPDCKY